MKITQSNLTSCHGQEVRLEQPDSETERSHLRLCVDWCADDLIYLDQKVSSIDEGIEEGSHYKQFDGDIFIYNSVTNEKIHWIQRAS